MRKACKLGDEGACEFVPEAPINNSKGAYATTCNDTSSCSKDCTKGNMMSCAIGGGLFLEQASYQKAKELLMKACTSSDQYGIAVGCNKFGKLMLVHAFIRLKNLKEGTAKKAEQEKIKQAAFLAQTAFKKACDIKHELSSEACENYKKSVKNGISPEKNPFD